MPAYDLSVEELSVVIDVIEKDREMPEGEMKPKIAPVTENNM